MPWAMSAFGTVIEGIEIMYASFAAGGLTAFLQKCAPGTFWICRPLALALELVQLVLQSFNVARDLIDT